MVKDSPTLDLLEHQHGISVERFSLRNFTTTSERVRWILNRLKQNPPDLFVPDYLVAGLYAGKWVRAAGIPTLSCFRSDDPYYWANGDRFLWGKESFRVSGVACVSETLSSHLAAKIMDDIRIEHIPSGVPIPDRVMDQSKPGFKVCYLGRMIQHQKRIHETAAALFRNLEQGVCDEVGFIGVGPELDYVRRLASIRGQSDRVNFHGEIAPSDLSKVLQHYHASVLLSDFEGTPGAVMDAMANGLVPVALALPDGTSELVIEDQTGMLVENRYSSFDDALAKLGASQELRVRLAMGARVHIEKKFSLDTCVRKWMRLANLLIESERAIRPRGKIKVPWYIHLPPAHTGHEGLDIRPELYADRLRRYIRRMYAHALWPFKSA